MALRNDYLTETSSSMVHPPCHSWTSLILMCTFQILLYHHSSRTCEWFCEPEHVWHLIIRVINERNLFSPKSVFWSIFSHSSKPFHSKQHQQHENTIKASLEFNDSDKRLRFSASAHAHTCATLEVRRFAMIWTANATLALLDKRGEHLIELFDRHREHSLDLGACWGELSLCVVPEGPRLLPAQAPCQWHQVQSCKRGFEKIAHRWGEKRPRWKKSLAVAENGFSCLSRCPFSDLNLSLGVVSLV